MPTFASDSSRFIEQDVASRISYSEDWADFLALVPGDEIQASSWAASDPALVLSDESEDGAITSVFASGGVAGGTYRVSNTVTTTGGRSDIRYFYLSVVDGAAMDLGVVSTALFNRFTSVKDFRAGALSLLSGSFPVENVTDDKIWESLVAAESQASHDLRILFQPTAIIPSTARQAEIDALVAAGTPFRQEAPYDYDPIDWTADSWGMIVLRQKPVARVDSIRFTYPNQNSDVITIPSDWIRLDGKYGHVQLVPTGTMMGLGPLSSYLLQAMSAGRLIPQMIHVRYTAGLENPARDYPDLVNLIKRMAVLRVLKSSFIPQSGSISADGLSQSSSVDVGKWQDEIDRDLEALRDLFHGVRVTVV